MPPQYHFTSRWEVRATPAAVYEALSDLVSYPIWWPSFRDVRRLDKRRHWMAVHSFLGYDIEYVLTQVKADPKAFVLEGRVDGDISGHIRWNMVHTLAGSLVLFEEEVATHNPLLNAVAPVARRLLEASHAYVMKEGEVGLAAFLAGRLLQQKDDARQGAGVGHGHK